VKNVILDTNAYIKFLIGDEKVLCAIAKADTVYMSVIVLGELYAGFKGGSKEYKNKSMLEKFLQKSTVKILDITHETSEVFAQIKNTLIIRGTLLPTNDIWIASNAVETGSVIVTYDNHFKKITGIRLWDEL